MNRSEAVEFVHELERTVNAHDTARLLQFYADNAISRSPMAAEVTGLSAIAENWDKLFSLMPDWTVQVQDVLVDGHRLAFRGTASATDRNGWFGQPATGHRIEFDAMVILTMDNGRILRDERIYDLAGVLERLEKARLDRELRMAAEVQRVLLPRRAHRTSFCEAVADSLPCRAIGGDYFELAPLASGAFAVALGDVSGKGPASALIAAMIQGMLSVVTETESSPALVLRNLNSMLARRIPKAQFSTLVYGVLHPDGRFVYANGGHNPPAVVANGCLRRLTAGGPPLGLFPDSLFEEESVVLREGDTLVLFSDGAVEARDSKGRQLDDDRFMSCLTGSATSSPPEMLREIMARVEEFCDGTPYEDDVTVAVVRFSRLEHEPG